MTLLEQMRETMRTMCPVPRDVLHTGPGTSLAFLPATVRATPATYLFGIPVQVDEGLPPGTAELRNEAGEVLCRVENLPVEASR